MSLMCTIGAYNMQKIFGFLAAAMIVLTPAAALAEGAVAVKGKMLYGAGGSRLGRRSSSTAAS